MTDDPLAMQKEESSLKVAGCWEERKMRIGHQILHVSQGNGQLASHMEKNQDKPGQDIILAVVMCTFQLPRVCLATRPGMSGCRAAGPDLTGRVVGSAAWEPACSASSRDSSSPLNL